MGVDDASSCAVVSEVPSAMAPSATAAASHSANVVIEPAPLPSQPVPDVKVV